MVSVMDWIIRTSTAIGTENVALEKMDVFWFDPIDSLHGGPLQSPPTVRRS
jgi:hypothetical protein